MPADFGRYFQDFEGLNEALRSEVPRLALAGLTPEELKRIAIQLFDSHFPRPYDPAEIDAAKAAVAAASDEHAALQRDRNRSPRFRVHAKADPAFRPDVLSRAVGMVAAGCATIALATIPLMAAANFESLKHAKIFSDAPFLLAPFGVVQLGLAFGAIGFRETLQLESSRRLFDRVFALGGATAFFALASVSTTADFLNLGTPAPTPLGAEASGVPEPSTASSGARSSGLFYTLISVADFFGVGLLHGLIRNNLFPLTDERVTPSVEREFFDSVSIPAAEGRLASAERALREMEHALAAWEAGREQSAARLAGDVALAIAHANALGEAARLQALMERRGAAKRDSETMNPAAFLNGYSNLNGGDHATSN